MVTAPRTPSPAPPRARGRRPARRRRRRRRLRHARRRGRRAQPRGRVRGAAAPRHHDDAAGGARAGGAAPPSARPGRDVPVADLRLQRRPHALPRGQPAPALLLRVEARRLEAPGVPAGGGQADALLPQEQRRGLCGLRAQRERALAQAARLARRLFTVVVENRVYFTTLSRRDVGARRAARAARSGPRTSRAAPSPHRWRWTGGCTSAPRTAPCTRCGASDGRVLWTLQGERRGEGRARLLAGQALLRRLRRPGDRHPLARRQARVAHRAPPAGASAARATSTPPRRSPSGACTSATPTAASTRSRRAAAGWRGRKSTGAYVYGSPAVAAVPGYKPAVYVGSYTASSSRSTRAAARRSGPTNAGGRISGSASVVGQARVLRQPRQEEHHGARRAHGRAWSGSTAADRSPPSSPTAGGSTSRAMRASTRSSPLGEEEASALRRSGRPRRSARPGRSGERSKKKH